MSTDSNLFEQFDNVWVSEGNENVIHSIKSYLAAPPTAFTLEVVLEVNKKIAQTLRIFQNFVGTDFFESSYVLNVRILLEKLKKKMYRLKYRLKHFEGFKAKEKFYNQKHYEKIKHSELERTECSCGSIYTIYSKAKHLKSKKHLEYLNLIHII